MREGGRERKRGESERVREGLLCGRGTAHWIGTNGVRKRQARRGTISQIESNPGKGQSMGRDNLLERGNPWVETNPMGVGQPLAETIFCRGAIHG